MRNKEAISKVTAASPPRRDEEAGAHAMACSPSVVVALFGSRRPSACVQRAAMLARDTRAALHLVRVLPAAASIGGALTAHNTLAILRAVERALVADRTTRSWIHELSLPRGVPQRLVLLHGDFVAQIVRYVEAVDAQLLLLPVECEDPSRLVSALTARTRTPVLVSRPPYMAQTIIAATDLMDAEYPVLRFASEFGQRLNSGIVAVHNLDPDCVVGSRPVSDVAVVLHGEPGRSARLEELRRVSQRLAVPVQSVVRDDADAVDAILGEAQLRDADLVVVGWRPRAQCERGANGVASRVIDLAQRSVLVIPMSAAVER